VPSPLLSRAFPKAPWCQPQRVTSSGTKSSSLHLQRPGTADASGHAWLRASSSCRPALSAEQQRQLVAAGLDVRTESVERIEERNDGIHVVLHQRSVVRDALFIQPQLALASDVAVTLGAELTDAGTVSIDPAGQSSVPGLYIAGDAATPVQSVAVATGSGARAAYAINASLLNQLPKPCHDSQPHPTHSSEV
jgi:pyruvate/2-oxoglutarate dehydrogenase complex dihydrolipoamide dehydrogenase (E3) component